MKTLNLFIGLLVSMLSFGQSIETRLADAVKRLEKDEQFKHAILAMYVVDSKTGKVMYDKNSQVGLAPASCQKVITSVSAFEMLGKDFRYKTSLSIDLYRQPGNYNGLITVHGSGDPTLGSWRFDSTKPSYILDKWCKVIKKTGIKKFHGVVRLDDVVGLDDMSMLPDGYIWQDIGNYYGANTWLINWRENQYDIKFMRGSVNQVSTINSIFPEMPSLKFINSVTIGEEGSGDNAYIYCPPYSDIAFIKGTIPPNKNDFTISGSMPHPALVLGNEMIEEMKKNNIDTDSSFVTTNANWRVGNDDSFNPVINESIQYSPTLDSMNYWFLKKSVNLYGEAFLKTIGRQNEYKNSTDAGAEEIKKFWSKHGIERSALNIIDGSGLSSANHVTTYALVTIMQYAKLQNWFSSFYAALPELNGIKMKDGYINGVRSFTGYVKSKTGTEYTFSFIVNNFDGSAGTVREKMWKLLDFLK